MISEQIPDIVGDIASLVGNDLKLEDSQRFAAIIGMNPSQGARSPVLWNAAFDAHGIDTEMIPFDVTQENLGALLAAVEGNANFIGGAVAVPYKEAVARWLGERLTPEAAAIGAVNCLYRALDGRLMGTNTDGEGALASFEAARGSVAGRSVLILGPGGAGKAVAAYFASSVKSGGRLAIVGRSETGRSFADRLGVTWINWSDVTGALSSTDVLVNCTSVGAGAQTGRTPLAVRQLALLPSHAVVFDIIYQSRPSALLSLAMARGLSTLDGLAMNLEQAVLAWGHAAPQSLDPAVTRVAMEAVAKNLST